MSPLPPSSGCRSRRERGLAMVAVLLVLMVLFVLSAPFLVTVRNADQASSESTDRAVLRVALESAARHGAARLQASHPAVDSTPYYDDLEELRVSNQFPGDFLATNDSSQVMWDLEADDVAARVDLASASPHVLANLIGGAARLTTDCKDKDTALALSGAVGFLPEGAVWVDDELMGYAEVGPARLERLARGLLVQTDVDGKPYECSPAPAKAHEVGAFVLDQRAFALCEWRTATNPPAGKLRAYESIEQVREAADFMLGPEFGREAFLALERTTSAFGHVRAGARWQRAARVRGDPAGAPQYGCKLPVDDLRWFNPGTTVWITDGRNSEYGLVRSTESGVLVLSEPLRSPYRAFQTVVAPLARVPVNVNTATPEVLRALWTNLKLRNKSARITESEAEKLVDLALVSRPFTGFEDFLRRLVLPAGGLEELPADAPIRPQALEELARESKIDAAGKKVLLGFIDADDARALYKNALNANDNELEFATMPLCFTSRDVYELELRASVNAPSGIERASGVRALAELVVPQRDLLAVWTRQEEFDEAPRLDLGAAGWLSGPVPTSRFDPLYGEIDSMRWPTRARAHLGLHDSQPSVDPLGQDTNVYCFASREDEDGWVQLAPYREEDAARRTSWALHFDDESKVLEGRYLPDGAAPLELAKLGWSGSGSLMSPMAFALWVKPRELEEGARLLDVSGRFSDADRLTLLFEGGDLVLRVLDGAGDHPISSFKEQAELRHPLSGGAGLPLDTWSHIQLAVEGTRPDQMALWIDGRRAEETPGLTRLTAGIAEDSDTIPVESTDGFPEKCVLRIGDELIEAHKAGPKAFRCKYESSGENAGFGGRLARELFQGVDTPGQEVNLGLYKNTNHPAGTTVALYGYSLPLYNNVASGGSPLAASLGPFAVARAVGLVVGGREQDQQAMEVIQATLLSGNPLVLGWGLDSQKNDVEALVLAPADPGGDPAEVMKAFSSTGGYAALLAPRLNLTVSEGILGTTQVTNDRYGVRLGGVEVIRYDRVEGNRLYIQQRGDQVRLPGMAGGSADVLGRGAFLFAFQGSAQGWGQQNDQLSAQTMVIPISIPTRGGGGVTGFPNGSPGRSEFVQLTRTGSDAHLTEWVRYDDVSGGDLVRDDPTFLLAANVAAHAGIGTIVGNITVNPPRVGGGGGGSRIQGEAPNGEAAFARLPTAEPSVARPRRPAPAQGGQSFWNYRMGESEDDSFFVTRAVRTQFQFRGVMGTYSHAQPSGTTVLPVYKLPDVDESAGYPGRFDHVTFFFDDPALPSYPAVVQRSYRPSQYTITSWADTGTLGAADTQNPQAVRQSGLDLGVVYVGLQSQLSVFIPANGIGNQQNVTDNRKLARMTLFPSGELPREVMAGQLGGDSRARGTVPSVTVDEALFFPGFGPSLGGMPGQFVVTRDFGESDTGFLAEKDTLRTTQGDTSRTASLLAVLPEHGGLLRIGDEFLCYDSYDASSFAFTIPSGGRGLLGSSAQPHRVGESITYIGSQPVAILGANVGPDDGLLPLLEVPRGFPSQGTVWIEGELVHYSSTTNALLEMPRASLEPGKMDEKGPGLFRGRFGTPRAGHGAGTPVVLFPFRYWDRWSELADAPEMTYYQLACEQPDAYWKRTFWKVAEPGFPGPQLGVLQRTNQDTPWDDRPEVTNGLTLHWSGKLDGGGNPVGTQSDRIEWRVFVRHQPGSFDPLAGLAHGWKTTPRLELFGVEFMGPSRTLARVDR